MDLNVPMQIGYRIFGTFLFCFFLPKLLIDLLLRRKTKSWMQERFFPKPLLTPPDDDRPLIWVHAVSVGEVMAVEPVLRKLLEERSCRIVLSTVTITGMETAKKRCSELVDEFYFLPFDFRFSIRRLFKYVCPDLIVFSEGDIWPEFLFQAKKSGSKVAIVNAKLSDRSFNRMRCFPRIGRWLFSKIDTICVQNELYAKRFQKIISKKTTLLVTGNTKGDTKKSSLQEIQSLKERLHISSEWIVTLGSTHAPEEQKILESLQPFLEKYAHVKVIIVPRHPHRFHPVYEIVNKCSIGPVACLSTLSTESDWKVLIVDQMGLLESLYAISSVAIVCGSFVESIGGHNILEALQWGVPSVVGPFMRSQKSIMEIAEHVGGVVQVEKFSEIPSVIERMVDDQEYSRRLSHEAILVSTYAQGAAQRCADSLNQLLFK